MIVHNSAPVPCAFVNMRGLAIPEQPEQPSRGDEGYTAFYTPVSHTGSTPHYSPNLVSYTPQGPSGRTSGGLKWGGLAVIAGGVILGASVSKNKMIGGLVGGAVGVAASISIFGIFGK